MADALKIALILTAFDQASGVIESMTNKANANFDKMRKASREMAEGFGLLAAGQAGFNFLKGPIKDFAEVEKSAARLRSNLLDGNGILNEGEWSNVTKLARDLGNELPGTTSDFYKMFTVMKQLGTETSTILGGTGRAASNLAIAIGEDYTTVAEAAGKLQNATGIAASDANKFFDTIARTRNLGVPLQDMVQAFSRSAGQLKFLGIQGLEASQHMSAFFATFVRQGLSGQTVGTNFSRILGEVLNPEKYQKMQRAANQYGITLDLLDKKGNFGGIDNFISQFDKLSGLSTDKIASILSPLTGAEGMDDQMLKALSKGREEFDKMTKGMAGQASLDTKVDVQLNTLDAQLEALEGTWTNVKASFGESLMPALKPIVEMLGQAATGLQNFVAENPKLAEFIGLFIGIASAGLMIAGSIRIITGVMKVLDIVMMANPIGLVILAIAAAAALVIVYWKPIKAFFIQLWDDIAAKFNWFIDLINPKRLGEAGAKIVMSIWDGIRSKWGEFMAWWAEKIQGIRDYLPFSPAKRGALRDIHRIRLVETIAQGIKPKAMFDAMDTTMGAVANYGGRRGSARAGGSSHMTFAPVYNFAAGTSKADAMQVTQNAQAEFERRYKEMERQKGRVGY